MPFNVLFIITVLTICILREIWGTQRSVPRNPPVPRPGRNASYPKELFARRVYGTRSRKPPSAESEASPWDKIRPRTDSVRTVINLTCTPPAPPPPFPLRTDAGLEQYTILNPEGEAYTIDTKDRSSVFYGKAWNVVRKALTGEEFLRATVLRRKNTSAGSFSGYDIQIQGIRAFLPRSRSGCFSSSERNMEGKSVIVKPFAVYPAGRKKGTLLVESETPLEQLECQENSEWAIGIDFDNAKFYFALGENRLLWCRTDEASKILRETLGSSRLEEGTGRYFRLDKETLRAGCSIVTPIEVLS